MVSSSTIFIITITANYVYGLPCPSHLGCVNLCSTWLLKNWGRNMCLQNNEKFPRKITSTLYRGKKIETEKKLQPPVDVKTPSFWSQYFFAKHSIIRSIFCASPGRRKLQRNFLKWTEYLFIYSHSSYVWSKVPQGLWQRAFARNVESYNIV